MATYKVIQDIEAEDKLLGPLTLRQFIYAAFVIVMGFIAFKLATISPLFILPFVLPMIFFGMLAAPFGHDQSSEVWMLAKIRFMLKPRKRVWDQSGIQELVTITAPKKVEHALTNGLSQTEVKSRLHALANTIDSRGWAVKNVNVNLSSQPSYLNTVSADSDRLVDASSLPQEVPTYDVLATDDMLDEKNNLTAQHLDSMITQSEQSHRQALIATVQGKAPAGAQPADYWFMNQPDPANIPAGLATFSGNPTVVPGAVITNPVTDNGADEQALLEQIHKDQARPDPGQGHMKVIDPNGPKPRPAATKVKSGKAAIARLANNDDLNVATIAREAQKATEIPPDDEVVISLR
jgi:hypothetical protein